MPKSMNKLKLAVRRLVTAHVADSWKGGGHPEDIPAIEKELKRAHERYVAALAVVTSKLIAFDESTDYKDRRLD